MLPEKESFVFALEDFLAVPASHQTEVFQFFADHHGVFGKYVAVLSKNFGEGFSECFRIDQAAFFHQLLYSICRYLRHAQKPEKLWSNHPPRTENSTVG